MVNARMTNSDVLVEDKLFATLDPTTRRLALPSGKEALLSDTVGVGFHLLFCGAPSNVDFHMFDCAFQVGFIQKLPTQLVAAFRATLEEMQDASLIVHVVDISHANAAAQADAVVQVLQEVMSIY